MIGISHQSDLIRCTGILEYKAYEFTTSWNSTPVVKNVLRCFRHQVPVVAGSKSAVCLIHRLWFIGRVSLSNLRFDP
jgi:hypothetical protein